MSHGFVRFALGALVCAGLVTLAHARPRPSRPRPAAGHAAAPSAPVDVAAARAALGGGDVAAAAAAATTLGTSATPDAHEALLDALATGLHPTVAAAAAAALARHPAPPDVAALLLYAGHRDPGARAAAVAALGAYPDPAAHQAVVAALGDDEEAVRAAAGRAVAQARIKDGVARLLALLDKGDAAAPAPLAQLADPDLAHDIAEHLGTAPGGALAQTLGAILKRADFPEPARVQVVRALAKIPGPDATSALTDYVEATPEKPPRQSRREAEAFAEQRLNGGGS